MTVSVGVRPVDLAERAEPLLRNPATRIEGLRPSSSSCDDLFDDRTIRSKDMV